MTIGFPMTKADIDTRLGLEVGDLWKALAAIHARRQWLDDSAHNTTFMTTAPLSYTSGEDTTIRAAITDLDKLWQISHAAATQGAANDFFFNAKLLGGTNYFG